MHSNTNFIGVILLYTTLYYFKHCYCLLEDVLVVYDSVKSVAEVAIGRMYLLQLSSQVLFLFAIQGDVCSPMSVLVLAFLELELFLLLAWVLRGLEGFHGFLDQLWQVFSRCILTVLLLLFRLFLRGLGIFLSLFRLFFTSTLEYVHE